MMHPLWLSNFASYCVQVAALVAAGGLAAALLRLRQPRVMLVYWQALLEPACCCPSFNPGIGWPSPPRAAPRRPPCAPTP